MQVYTLLLWSTNRDAALRRNIIVTAVQPITYSRCHTLCTHCTPQPCSMLGL